MAMLLAMYQKMRLIREKNQATLDLTRFSSKYDRVSKNIERVQKMYTSKIASLESQAKLMMTSAKSIFQATCGLTMDGNFLNPSGYGQMNGFMLARIQEYASKGLFGFDANGNFQQVTSDNGISAHKFDTDVMTLYQLYTQGKLSATYWKTDENDKENVTIDGTKISTKDITAFQNLITAANAEYSQRSMAMNQMNSNYETNVSIWLEAAKAQLEAEQDAAVEPLAYQQTMWELEKTQTEAKLERIKADLESYDRLCSDETKGHAPRFGLG